MSVILEYSIGVCSQGWIIHCMEHRSTRKPLDGGRRSFAECDFDLRFDGLACI